MLVRFSVENYRSFKERQVFSMAAGKFTRHKGQVAIVNKKRILKGAVIFGANASGKSNLVSAINTARRIVIEGANLSLISGKYFKIDPEYKDKPGVFQFDFFSNGHFYSYGFAVSYLDGKIISEWLYLCDSGEKCIFERGEDGTFKQGVKFKNENDQKRFDIYSQDVPDNSAFLTEIVRHKLGDDSDFKCFFDVYKWIVSLVVIFPRTKYGSIRQYLMNQTLDTLGELMDYFDTGIKSIVGMEKTIDEALAFLPSGQRKEIIDDIMESFSSQGEFSKKTSSVEANIAGKRFSFTRNKDGEVVAKQLVMDHGNKNEPFELEDESDGTRRLFDLAPIYNKGKQDCVIIIDELDRSFHSKLTLEFIRRFFDETQFHNCQIIATMHDLNAMDLDFVRQDEIWFVERENDQSSHLYSLNRFKTRFDDRSVAKDYLLGRYGAVPRFF